MFPQLLTLQETKGVIHISPSESDRLWWCGEGYFLDIFHEDVSHHLHKREEGSGTLPWLHINDLFCWVSKSSSNKVGVNIKSEVLIKWIALCTEKPRDLWPHGSVTELACLQCVIGEQLTNRGEGSYLDVYGSIEPTYQNSSLSQWSHMYQGMNRKENLSIVNGSERLNFRWPVLQGLPRSGLGSKTPSRRTIEQHHSPFMIGFGIDGAFELIWSSIA